MNIFSRRRVFGLTVLLAMMTTTSLTACGQAQDAGGAGDGQSLTVMEPVSGATVTLPFRVRLDSSVPLGPTESGKHHVHIWFDDNEADYLIVESDVTQVTTAPSGQHTMHVSLRNANHSAAGVEATIPVTVGGGVPASPQSGASQTAPDTYSY